MENETFIIEAVIDATGTSFDEEISAPDIHSAIDMFWSENNSDYVSIESVYKA